MDYIKKIKKHSVIQVVLFIVLLVIDQLTKFLAVRNLKGQPGVPLIKDVLEFQYLENTGAAFGFLKNKQILFYIITLVVLFIVVFVWLRVRNSLKKYAKLDSSLFVHKTYKNAIILNYVIVILGSGAIGNFIDRIIHNYVVDFIYFKVINFPIFNFADICVTCSAIFLVIYFLFIYKEDANFTIFSSKNKAK